MKNKKDFEKKIKSFWYSKLLKEFSEDFDKNLLLLLTPENENYIVEFLLTMSEVLEKYDNFIAKVYYNLVVYRLVLAQTQKAHRDVLIYIINMLDDVHDAEVRKTIKSFIHAEPKPFTSIHANLMNKIKTEKKYEFLNSELKKLAFQSEI